MSYLRVKGIIGQLVDTLKLVSVGLGHLKHIFCSLEDQSLIQPTFKIITHCGLSNPFHQHMCFPFPLCAKSGAFLVISVLVDNRGSQRRRISVSFSAFKDTSGFRLW